MKLILALALVFCLLHPWLVLVAEVALITALAVVIARAAGWRPRPIFTRRTT